MHTIYTGQLVGAARRIDTDEVRKAIAELERAQAALADHIASELGIRHVSTSFDIDEKVGSHFAPTYRGQPAPDEIRGLGVGSDWVENHEEVPGPEPKTVVGTLYIAPGNRYSRIFAIPYPMKPRQSPADLPPNHMRTWVQVGTMNADGKIVALNPSVSSYRNELEGQVAGTFMDAQWLAPAEEA
ncbi:hypothetical protein [Marinobacter salicampi]|uniref:hypothetical protein n=1 Tax=Marinobacter salicampi TaxID=435907 RepID=UPI001409E3E4|nr:hypothetical protein [Marinobacter salicampi]